MHFTFMMCPISGSEGGGYHDHCSCPEAMSGRSPDLAVQLAILCQHRDVCGIGNTRIAFSAATRARRDSAWRRAGNLLDGVLAYRVLLCLRSLSALRPAVDFTHPQASA